ncbi:MAG: hypothetical protein ACRECC_11375 [Pseudolabrys sp.]|jgi:hypothetical protein
MVKKPLIGKTGAFRAIDDAMRGRIVELEFILSKIGTRMVNARFPLTRNAALIDAG